MDISGTTFILEVVNFLVLVWVLKRLFYRPVLKAIEERKKVVQEKLDSAEKSRKEALELRDKYEGRFREWESEKQKERAIFNRQIEEEKTNRKKELEAEMETERQKAQVRREQGAARERDRQEEEAVRQSLVFLSKLLKKIASPDTERRIIEMFLEEISNLPSGKTAEWKGQTNGESPKVWTAFELEHGQKALLLAGLQDLFGKEVQPEWRRDEGLLAGIRVETGSIVLKADLRDELDFFAEDSLHG